MVARLRSGDVFLSFAYRFAGVEIDSEVAISDLRFSSMRTSTLGDLLSIRQEQGPPPNADHIVFAWPGRYGARLGTIDDDWMITSRLDGAFRIDPAYRTLRIYSERACIDVLVRRILPRLMVARGAMTIHAAAVATQGSGILLLGASGAGKSTTTAALAAMPGWDLFSDDLSTIWEGSPPQLAPSASGVCLWQPSVAGLALDPARCTAMPGYDGKFRFEPEAPPVITPVPLRAFVFLAQDPECRAPTLTPMIRANAFIRAIRQLNLFNPADAEQHEQAIARLSRIAAGLPMLRLSYPPRYDVFPAIADLLTEQVLRCA
jgi:hypothetical protein